MIGPDKKIKLMLVYPMTTGRNFDEILRVLDSMQLTAKHKVATPANWKQGEDVIIVPAVRTTTRRRSIPTAGRRSSPTCDHGAAGEEELSSALPRLAHRAFSHRARMCPAIPQTAYAP